MDHDSAMINDNVGPGVRVRSLVTFIFSNQSDKANGRPLLDENQYETQLSLEINMGNCHVLLASSESKSIWSNEHSERVEWKVEHEKYYWNVYIPVWPLSLNVGFELGRMIDLPDLHNEPQIVVRGRIIRQ